MNYSAIKWTDIANGEGVRVSLFVSGCTRRCPNCFNEIAWDFTHGECFDQLIQEQIINALKADYIAGISLLGGEPLEPQNQKALYPFIKQVKELYPNKTVWCYTGCIYDESNGCLKEPQKNTEITKQLISLFDVLVDGPYIEELKDVRLKFRGSSNQRVIDVKKSLSKSECILYFE